MIQVSVPACQRHPPSVFIPDCSLHRRVSERVNPDCNCSLVVGMEALEVDSRCNLLEA